MIPRFQELHDGLFQLFDAEERTPADPLARQLAEPPFHQIKPTGAGGHKVRDEARVAAEPGLNLGSFMGAVVVHHQMQMRFTGKLLVQTAQKLQPLLMPMPCLALTDDPALQNLQSGEQSRGPVALVIVRQGPTPFLQRQTGLGAIQRLLRRIQIQTYHIGQLLPEFGVAGELKSSHPVGLEIMAPPEVAHRGLAHSLVLRQQPATPRGHPLGFALQRRLHQGFDPFRPISRLAPAGDFPQALQTVLGETPTPQAHRLAMSSQWTGDRGLRLPLGRRQNNPACAAPLAGACRVRSTPAEFAVLDQGSDSTQEVFEA